MTNLIRTKFVALLVAVTILLGSMPVSVPTVSAETVYSFTGGGKSHGVGMSMAGVKVLAKAGRDYPTIIKHYYRGVSVGPKGGLPKIVRAAVYGTAGAISFSANNHIRVYDTRGRYLKTVLRGEVLWIKYGNGKYRIIVKRGAKQIYNRLHPFSLVVKRWKASVILLRNNGKRYEGDFFARSIGSKQIWAINRVPLENYLRGLGEEPETWPIKGLRTLAVAARTYAVEKILKRKKHYDLNQTQQFYVGIRKAPRMAFAVNSTRGRIITYQGQPIIAAYSANNGGFEADFRTIWGGQGYPYLVAKEDPWSKNTTDYRWGPINFTRTQLETIFKRNGVNVGTLTDIQFDARGTDQRPSKVTIVGTAASKTVWTYGQFSRWLGLKSSLIWLNKSESASVGRALSSTLSTVNSGAFGKRALQQPRIVLDPGHGGRQYGAVGPNRLAEKTVNLRVALRLRRYLQAAGAKVIMTRTTDKTLSLAARVAIAKKARANRFVSIHHNSSVSRRANGTETYMRRGADTLSIDMAKKAHAALIGSLKLGNRGVRRASFFVLRNTRMPAILTEASFISNKAQASRLRSAAYIDKEARAIYYGLKAHMNLNRLYAPVAIQNASSPAADIHFPYVTDTSSYWRSFVALKNTSAVSQAVTLNYYDVNGALVKSEPITLAPKQDYGFYPRLQIGGDFTGSIRAIAAEAVLVGSVSQASNDNKALGNVQALTPATELHAPRVVDDGVWSTKAYLKNTADTAATATINYYDKNGALVKSETPTINSQSIYTISPMASIGTAFDGSVEVQATTQIVGYVARINAAQTRLGIAPMTTKATNLYFAQAPDNNTWLSYLTLKNTSSDAQTITVTALDANGVQTAQNNITLGAKAVWDARVINVAGANFSGSLRINGQSENVAAYVTQTDTKTKALGVIEAAQPAQNLEFAHVSDGGAFWNSEVVFDNVGDLADLYIEFYNPAGVLLSSVNHSMATNNLHRFYPWETTQQVFNGSISATAPTAQIVGYMSQSH